MNNHSTALLRLVPLKWQRVFEHCRMIKYYRVLRRFRKKVLLLGKLIFKKSMPFLFLQTTVCSLFYLLCLLLGSMDLFQSLLSKMGLSLGGRALSFFVSRCLGLEGGLALAIAVLFKAIFTAEAAPDLGNQMASSGAENSVSSWHQYLRNSSSNTEGESAHEPSSWTGALRSSSETETGGTGTSVNQGVARPRGKRS